MMFYVSLMVAFAIYWLGMIIMVDYLEKRYPDVSEDFFIFIGLFWPIALIVYLVVVFCMNKKEGEGEE